MNLKTFVWKVLVVSAMAFAGRIAIGATTSALLQPGWQDMPGFERMALPLFIGTIVTVAVLAWPAMASRYSGYRLWLALFLAVFGINVVLIQIEAVVFLNLTSVQLADNAVQGTLNAALLALLVAWAFGSQTANGSGALPERISVGGWAWRIGVSAPAYVLLYLVAGMLILPHVQAFYDAQDMGVGIWFLPLQLLRGSLYVFFVAMLLRSLDAPRGAVSLATAMLFPVLAGVAGLLAPNPLMPDHVRLWHIIEIGASNFAYGLLVGFLFWKPRSG